MDCLMLPLLLCGSRAGSSALTEAAVSVPTAPAPTARSAARRFNSFLRFMLMVLALLMMWAARSGAFQAEAKLKSGPQQGQALPGPFHFLNVNGAHAGNPHCLVCEYGLEPVVMVFTREVPDKLKPLGDLLKK